MSELNPEPLYGRTQPRIFTPPLRELTPETSHGFEVIQFAREVLDVQLRPWQEWLLIHALELDQAGGYRFQKVVVLVARQNGKTLLSSVLAAWWLFVDSFRHPRKLPSLKFKVVGVAQNIDIAREPWAQVKTWCDPAPETSAAMEAAIPMLQESTAKVLDANGKEQILCQNNAHYEVRAAANARGKPAPRIIFDELREQTNWRAWSAVSHTLKSFGTLGQLWGFSNAGASDAVVLKSLRAKGHKLITKWHELVETKKITVEQFEASNDTTLGFFEWSAPDDCSLDDVDGVLQANPSIGYGQMSVKTVMAGKPPEATESDYRTEALCQWVIARIEPFISPEAWRKLEDPDSRIADDSPLVISIDTTSRAWTYIAVAGYREDGLIHVEIIAQRPGMLWVYDALKKLRNSWSQLNHVALQVRGAFSTEFIEPAEAAGFEIIEISGSILGAVAGSFSDMVIDGKIRHLGQPVTLSSIEGTLVKSLNDVKVWDRQKSGTDASPTVALSQAAWALERLDAQTGIMPPPARLAIAKTRPQQANRNLENLAFMQF